MSRPKGRRLFSCISRVGKTPGGGTGFGKRDEGNENMTPEDFRRRANVFVLDQAKEMGRKVDAERDLLSLAELIAIRNWCCSLQREFTPVAQRGVARRGVAQRGAAQRGVAQRGVAQGGVAQGGIAQEEEWPKQA